MRTVRPALIAAAACTVALLAFAGCGGGSSEPVASGPPGASGAAGGIDRKILARDTPANAPGQTLYLEEVEIAPGAELPAHFHDGTQIASVRSGILTYDIVEGSAAVTRADGDTERIVAPAEITLRPGDSLTETRSLVHYGSNRGDEPVVISVAALLKDGAPLATPVK